MIPCTGKDRKPMWQRLENTCLPHRHTHSELELEIRSMRALIQRVSRARVTVNGEVTGEIAQGLLVLMGVGLHDTQTDGDYLADKIVGLRIFEDKDGKMNLSVSEIGG